MEQNIDVEIMLLLLLLILLLLFIGIGVFKAILTFLKMLMKYFYKFGLIGCSDCCCDDAVVVVVDIFAVVH